MRPAVWGAALVAGLSIAGAAQAADFVVVQFEGYVGIVDLAGITRKGETARGTVTRIWPKDEDGGGEVAFRYLVTDEEFNCATSVSSNFSVKAYSRAHVLVLKSDEPSGPLDPVAPGSLGHDVMRTLCEAGAPVGERQSAPDRTKLIDRLLGG